MKKTGILYDNISGNMGDVAIGISLKKMLRHLEVEFDELIPGNFNPLDYETIIIGGGYLLRQNMDFFYDKFKVPGNHILNAMGIYGEPKDLDYLKNYKYITVRSNGDKKKLEYLNEEIHVIPCTTMLLEDVPDLPFMFKKPCIGMHIFPIFSKEEEDQFIHWVSSLPFTVYFTPITHYNKDIRYMRYLKEKIPNSEVLPILKAQEIFTLCGKFDFFISCSLHGAIFSYVHNVPFILFDVEDKMRFFMEDRQLDRYLFKNFSELKSRFEELEYENPDYSEKITKDKKVLNDYLLYLASVLPLNKTPEMNINETSSEIKYQISYLLADISEWERQNALDKHQISDLTLHTHNLEVAVSERDCQINERNNQITEWRQHIQNLEAAVSERDCQINERNNQITEWRQHIHNLEAAVSERDCQINERNNQITEWRQHIHNLEAAVSERDCQINERNNQITEWRQHSRNLESVIIDQKQQLQEIIRFNQSLINENTSIKQSVTYSLTTKFHNNIVERLLPPSSRRRKDYNQGLSGCRLLVNGGRLGFSGCQSERKPAKTLPADQSIQILQPLKEILEPDKLPVIQTNVSVIIPTKNAGSDIQAVLEKIKTQKGIASVEIIIIDSGSADGTCAVAENYGCRVLPIQPDNFNHGLTRNYGAEHSTGDYLLFMVQDAMPIGDLWLYNMVKCLSGNPEIAAVTCRQVPRSDADLFACYSMRYHYRTMEIQGDRVIGIRKEDFSKFTENEKRKAAFLDDVCTCFKKEIYTAYRFKELNFAEDLDIALRLLEGGYKIAFLCSSGVIHSHNRDAGYFFRRSFVESKILPSILGESQQNYTGTFQPIQDLITELFWEYCGLLTVFSEPGLNISDSMSDQEYIRLIKKSLISPKYNGSIPNVDPTFFLEDIRRLLRDCNIPLTEKSLAENHFIDTLNAFFSHAETHPCRYNSDELKNAVVKLFAIYAGARLGNLYIHNKDDETMKCVDQLLSRGI